MSNQLPESEELIEMLGEHFSLWDLRHAFNLSLAAQGDDDEENEDENDEEEDEDDDAASGDGDKGDAAKGAVKDPEKKRLSDEAARHRLKAKNERLARRKAERELNELKTKDLPDAQKIEQERDEAIKERDKAKSDAHQAKIQLQLVRQASSMKFKDLDVVALLVEKEVDFEDLESTTPIQ